MSNDEKPTHVVIDVETLETLISVAEVGLLELKDGLDDGTYEDDAIAGIRSDDIRAAIEMAKGQMS